MPVGARGGMRSLPGGTVIIPQRYNVTSLISNGQIASAMARGP